MRQCFASESVYKSYWPGNERGGVGGGGGDTCRRTWN